MHKAQIRLLVCDNQHAPENNIRAALTDIGYLQLAFCQQAQLADELLKKDKPHVLIYTCAEGTVAKFIAGITDFAVLVLCTSDECLQAPVNKSVVIKPHTTNAQTLDLYIENAYLKYRFIKEVKRTEQKEQKINQKLLKELKQVAFYEQQILRSKQMYYSSLNALDDSVFVIDSELNIILENESFKKFKEELHIDQGTLGDSVSSICKHLNGFSMSEYILMMKTGEEQKAEVIQLSENYTGEVTKKPIFDEDEMVTRVITVIKNITKQYTNEQKIKVQTQALQSNLKNQKLVSKISLTLNTLDDFDKKTKHLLGVIGKNFDTSRVFVYTKNFTLDELQYTYEWCNKDIPTALQQRAPVACANLETLRDIFNARQIFEHADAKALPVEIKDKIYGGVTSILLFPLYSYGKISGILGIDELYANRFWNDADKEQLKTISGIISKGFQMRNMMTKIVESGQKTSAIVHAIPDMLYQLDKNGNFITIKHDEGSMLEKVQDKVNGKNIRELFTPEISSKLLQAIYLCTYKGKSVVEFELDVLNCKNNYEARFQKIDDKEVISIVRNITKQKQFEQKINIAKEQAVKANKSKDRLFSIISHDIKHPLADLKSLLDLLIYDVDRFDKDTLKKCFAEIKETTDATFNLLQDLLQWSRKEMNKITNEPIDFRIDEVISKNLELYKQGAAKKGIALELNGNTDTVVFADLNMADTIVRNLITNAIKFSKRDGKVILHLTEQKEYLQIAVQDFGIGIPEEHRDKILSKTEIHTTRGTANEKGTGVGLDLCNDFATMNKGNLWFETEVDKGTTFYFTVPLNKGQL